MPTFTVLSENSWFDPDGPRRTINVSITAGKVDAIRPMLDDRGEVIGSVIALSDGGEVFTHYSRRKVERELVRALNPPDFAPPITWTKRNAN